MKDKLLAPLIVTWVLFLNFEFEEIKFLKREDFLKFPFQILENTKYRMFVLLFEF